MSDEWTTTLGQLVEIATPCVDTSPLVSTFGGFGFALDCEKQSGHDGQHGRIIRWVNGNEIVGQLEATWA